LDIAALKTIGAWSALVTTLVVIMMAVTGIIKPAEALFFGSGILVGFLFASFSNRNPAPVTEPEENVEEQVSDESEESKQSL
jgi:hypothetical protein